MGKPYRECPRCGAHLDAGEICDCREKRQEKAAQPHEKMKLIAICREVDKGTGRIAVSWLLRSTRIIAGRRRNGWSMRGRKYGLTTCRQSERNR